MDYRGIAGYSCMSGSLVPALCPLQRKGQSEKALVVYSSPLLVRLFLGNTIYSGRLNPALRGKQRKNIS